MAGTVKRRNGFERPFTNDQILSWIAEPAAAVMFYLVVATFSSGATRTALLVVYSVLLVSHLVCWYICSALDPAEDKGWYWPCMKESQQTSRYCAFCKKNVPGLDHHCTWLNTCIGKRQYPAFFALVTIGTVMYWMETAYFIYLLTGGLTPEVEGEAVEVLGSITTYKVLISLATVFSGALAIGLSVLFSFHMFLQFVRMGTYTWLIDERERRIELRRRKKEEASTQYAAKQTKSTGGSSRQMCGGSEDATADSVANV